MFWLQPTTVWCSFGVKSSVLTAISKIIFQKIFCVLQFNCMVFLFEYFSCWLIGEITSNFGNAVYRLQWCRWKCPKQHSLNPRLNLELFRRNWAVRIFYTPLNFYATESTINKIQHKVLYHHHKVKYWNRMGRRANRNDVSRECRGSISV